MTRQVPDKPLRLFTPAERDALKRQGLTRREVLGHPARVAVAGGIALAGAPAIAAVQEATPEAAPTDLPGISEVPPTPSEPPEPLYVALTAEEAAILEALVSRILPGNDDDPGALEAGVSWYIDNLLAHDEGFRERVYRNGPWARPYEGETPPPDEDGVIWVPAAELGRYGLQSPLTPLEIYQIGLAATNQHAIDTYGQALAQLEPEDQDAVVWDLLRGDAAGFDQFSSFSFFQTLRLHTAEGMFSDPVYGGNRDLIGWRLVGFPGAQRAYLPSEIRGTSDPRPPQSLNELPHFHVGENEGQPNTVLPVRGTEDEEADD